MYSRRTLCNLCVSLSLGLFIGCGGNVDSTTDFPNDPSTNEILGESSKSDGTLFDNYKLLRKCYQKEADPFVIVGISQGGKNAGKCIDTTVFRAVKPLYGNEYLDIAHKFGFTRTLAALEELSGGDKSKESTFVSLAQLQYKIVANVKHQGKFWIAEIPLRTNMKNTAFLIEEFKIPVAEQLPQDLLELLQSYFPDEYSQIIDSHGDYTAAHGMLRMTFDNEAPVVLKQQYPQDPTQTEEIHELVLSVHAAGHVAGEYDPIEGNKNAYATVYGLFSLQEKVSTSVCSYKNRVRQLKLKIDPWQMKSVLTRYLERSAGQMNVPYNTVLRNCGSELFEIFDYVKGFDRNKEKKIPYSLIGRQYPKYAQFALVTRGLLPLIEGEHPTPLGKISDSQIDGNYRMETLNQQVANGSIPSSKCE